MVEGAWNGEDIEVNVTRDDGEATLQTVVARGENCDVPKRAAKLCAGMRVPATVTGTFKGRSFSMEFVQVEGTALAKAGATPTDTWNGLARANAPFESDAGPRDYITLLFSPDGLWVQSETPGEYELVAQRE